MYRFVDTIPGSGTGSTSLSIQTVFNGFNLDEELTDENGSFTTLIVSGRSNLNQKINTIEVVGKDGLVEEDGANLEPKEITVKYKILDKTNEGLRKRFDKLNSMLVGSKKELSFTDEEAIFYATLQTNDIPEEESNNLIGTITFLCTDPYKYGAELTANFTSDSVIVKNPGTAEADPIFELTAREPTTFAMISNGEEYMMIGQPLDADTEPFEREDLVLHDMLSNTTGWVEGEQVDDGIVSGEMVSDGRDFIAANFGTPSSGAKWYGPALKASLPETLENFRAEILIENFNGTNNVGRVALYLLNVNSEIIGRIHLVDAWQSINRNRVSSYVQSGDGSHRKQLHHIDETTAEATGELWNNFDGMLRMERVGNRWTAYVAKIREDGTHHARETKRYTDTAGYYTEEVAQIQLHIGIFGGYEPARMKIKDLKVWKINNLDEHQIPYIAKPGDSVVFDHSTHNCYLNGEPVNPDFGGDFFKLYRGNNSLVVLPEGVFDTTLKFRPRYR